LPEPLRLPQEPRPVVRVSTSARLVLAGQAPGTRVNNTGIPYNDPSGDRLRAWMNVSRETFYDESRFAIVPMGFCFPGLNAAKGDLPPRRECRELWHDGLFALMAQVTCVVAIGRYAQDYHLARAGYPVPKNALLADIVGDWKNHARLAPRIIALPHPSWRNNAWITRNPWFEKKVLPLLRAEVANALA
jgi:uracil-DNA glycosylase